MYQCQHCGNSFSISYWRRDTPQFCSAICRNKARTRPIVDRFWEKVNKTDTCWLWIGATLRDGFGVLGSTLRRDSAHRLSWEMHFGEIPADTFICQTCSENKCVNPDHLVLVSKDEFHQARMTPIADRFWSKVEKTNGCWLWTGANTGRDWPYGILGAGHRSDGLLKAHHVSWEIHNGPVHAHSWVLHKCDVTLCVRPDHLFLGTAADNTADMVSKGRCMTEKLTQDQVDELRLLYESGSFTMQALADKYDVSGGAISYAINRKTWKHRRLYLHV